MANPLNLIRIMPAEGLRAGFKPLPPSPGVERFPPKLLDFGDKEAFHI